MEAEAVFEMDDNFEEFAKIIVVGVGGGGGNAINNMIELPKKPFQWKDWIIHANGAPAAAAPI